MRRIKLMTDYYCYPLWGTTPEDIGDIDPNSLPISDKLKEQLSNFAADFDGILNINDPADSGFKTLAEALCFQERARELGKCLQDELGRDYEVVIYDRYADYVR